MPTQIYFQDVERLDHLEEYLGKRIQSVVDHFFPNGRYDLITRIQTDRARGDHKNPHFLCQIRLDTPQETTPIVIKKGSSNFYHAALQVRHVLQKVLRRRSSQKAQHHRRVRF